MSTYEEHGKKWAQVVAKAWMDDEFKQRLLSDPESALAEHGIEAAPGQEYKIVADSPTVSHLVLPAKPGTSGVADASSELQHLEARGCACFHVN